VRIVLNVVGLILALFGILWILQGLNLLPGSFMTGHIKWAIVGLLVLLVAVWILVSANRSHPAR
jgi:hypothetical protein